MRGGGIEDALRSLFMHLHSDGYDGTRAPEIGRDDIQVTERGVPPLLILGARGERVGIARR